MRKRKTKLHHHHDVISIFCTHIEHRSQPISKPPPPPAPQSLGTVLAQMCDVLSIRICNVMGFFEII